MIQLAEMGFDGPVAMFNRIPSGPGVYVILDNVNGSLRPIDVGEAIDMEERIRTHDRANCWKKQIRGRFEVAFYCTGADSDLQRSLIEGFVRSTYQLPCGKR